MLLRYFFGAKELGRSSDRPAIMLLVSKRVIAHISAGSRIAVGRSHSILTAAHSAAHSAAAAAHSGLGNRVDLLTVDYDSAAVIGRRTVIIEG